MRTLTNTSHEHEPEQFTLWLVAVIIILGALSFLPVLALGPIVEHLLLAAGTTFK